MTTPTGAIGTRRKVGIGGLLACYRLALATVVPRARLIVTVVGFLGLLALPVLIARTAETSPRESAQLALGVLLTLAVPIFCVSNATNAFGAAVTSDTLVYPWLRPVARWQLALAYCAAIWTLMLPAIALTAAASLLLGASAENALGYAAAGAVGVTAYTPIFVALGIRFKRASSIGLVYVILLDTFFSFSNEFIARLSIRNYATSVFAAISDDGHAADSAFLVDVGPALLALGLFAAFGIALSIVFLKRANVA